MKSLQRLSKEFHSLVNNPSPGISVDIIDSGMFVASSY